MSARAAMWLSPAQAADPEPNRAQASEDDHTGLSFHSGRFFRREAMRDDPDNTVTPAEQRLIGQRAEDAARTRLAERDRALAGLRELGAAVRAAGGAG
ncbi:hypothetical protein [Frigidibacter oleivorans]|uniref:hypothetical protein n=1 Tax=Frigidibacter oleivorans TaxID=2487129 RepID=UPI000F8EEEFC|nr:hypothetical protein [Frigidibacter oleivorans]